ELTMQPRYLLGRRRFLRLAVGASALPALSRFARAGLTATNLREGSSIAFHRIRSDEFLQGIHGGNVFPLTTMNVPGTDAGTQWTVHETLNPGVFRFECIFRDNEGLRFLEGTSTPVLGGGTGVGLGNGSSQGTFWKVADLENPDPSDPAHGFDHVILQCQGGSMGFLSAVEKCGHSFGGFFFCTVHIGLVPDPGT